MTTWKKKGKKSGVGDTMEWICRKTDTHVSHTDPESRKRNVICAEHKELRRSEKNEHSRDKTQKVKKVLTFFLKRKGKQPTSWCSVSPWSKLKDTSWSSSGREPWSNKALKKQSRLDVTPLCTLDQWSRQVVYELTIQRTQINMH